MQTILITGARAPIALEMARSFKQAGHRVLMADALHWTIARWSNSVDKYYVFPSPRFHAEGFIERIKFLIESESITHIIPTCEEAFYFSMYQHHFNCKIWVADFDTMKVLHSKYDFTEKSKPFFSVPNTIKLNEFTDWQNSENYVFKPVFSRFATSVIINQRISENTIPQNEHQNWIAQTKIKGNEICIYSIWEEGIMKAFVAYHPLYRVGKGAGIFFEPIENKLIEKQVKYFGETLKYTGQLCFDVIIDEYETPYFIECNPRGTSGGHLLNDRIAKAYFTETFERQTTQDFCIKYAMALLHPAKFFSKKVRETTDVIYKKSDILPFLLQILSLFEITYIKLKKGVSWLEATTGDIEWNGEVK